MNKREVTLKMEGFKFKIIFFILSLMSSVTAMSQSVISGYILKAEDGKPVADANVLVMPLNTGSVTDGNGYFEIKNLSPGKYDVSVSVVGFKTEFRHVTVKSDSHRSLKVYLIVENKTLGEVAVVGEGVEQRIMKDITVEPVSLKSTMSLVSDQDIARQGAVSLIDAMKYVPGALTETRGRKVKQFFSVRGQTYPYPTYAVDGVWQNEFYEIPYFLNSDNIQEIKIDRSSSALLKSLSPLSGVIDVISRKYDKRETNVNVKYGSLGTFNAGIVYGNATGKFNYSTGLQFFGTNGPAGRNGRERIVNFNTDLGWRINDKVKTYFKLFYLDGNRELVQPVYPAASKLINRREKYSPLTTLMLSSRTEFKPENSYTGELQLNYIYKNPKYYIKNLKTGTENSYRELDYGFSINQLNAWELGDANVLRAGVLFDHRKAPNGKRYYYGNPANEFTWSVVVTDQQRRGKWVVDGGFRLTQQYYKEWGGFAIEGSGGDFTDVEPITNEWQSPVWQLSVGFARPVNVLLSFYGNVNAGMVTPRTGAITSEGERPENEKRTNLDLGMITNFHNSGSLTISGFLVSRKDAIDYNGETLELENGDIVELYKNEDKRNFGMEIDWKMPVVNCLNIFANATMIKGMVKDSMEWKKDDEIPVFIGNVGANIDKSGFDFNVYMNYTGAYKNDRFVDKKYLQQYGKAPLGDFFDIDLTAGYTFGEKALTRFFVEVNNLLNTPFQTVVGYPDYGTIVSGGVKVKFKNDKN